MVKQTYQQEQQQPQYSKISINRNANAIKAITAINTVAERKSTKKTMVKLSNSQWPSDKLCNSYYRGINPVDNVIIANSSPVIKP